MKNNFLTQGHRGAEIFLTTKKNTLSLYLCASVSKYFNIINLSSCEHNLKNTGKHNAI